MSAAKVWTPRIVAFIRTKFESACYWCGYAVPRGSSAVFYADERETAHDSCHREACS